MDNEENEENEKNEESVLDSHRGAWMLMNDFEELGEDSGNKKKKVLRGIFSAFCGILIGVGLIFVCSETYQQLCKTRVYSELEQNVSELESSSICITRTLETGGQDEGGRSAYTVSYGLAGSGVIFDRDGDRYYALTAAHVVESKSEEGRYSWYVITAASETFDEYTESDHYGGTYEYYQKYLQELTVLYTSPDLDLAVVSFESEAELGVAVISEKAPQKGDKVFTCAIIDGSPFQVSYGKIISEKSSFQTSDGYDEGAVQKHTAYITEGSSGSGVMNENMELVGINVAGGTDIFGHFRFGALISAEQISVFLDDFYADHGIL